MKINIMHKKIKRHKIFNRKKKLYQNKKFKMM